MHDKFGNLAGWDLEGFHSGGDTEAWRRLGSHVVTVHDSERGDLRGTRFAVWAPNAQRVQVMGEFNWWQGDDMELVPGSGVWAVRTAAMRGAADASGDRFAAGGVRVADPQRRGRCAGRRPPDAVPPRVAGPRRRRCPDVHAQPPGP